MAEHGDRHPGEARIGPEESFLNRILVTLADRQIAGLDVDALEEAAVPFERQGERVEPAPRDLAGLRVEAVLPQPADSHHLRRRPAVVAVPLVQGLEAARAGDAAASQQGLRGL